MENQTKQMTGEESLRIITDMIQKTRVNIKHGSFHLLLWGWLILICSLSDYLIRQFTTFEKTYYVWWLTIPAIIVSMIYGFSKGRKQAVYTYIDRIYMWTWMAAIPTAAIMIIMLIGNNVNFIGSFMLMLFALPTFMSGIMIKFKPLMIGGVCFWILALVGHFSGPHIESLTIPIGMLSGYLIPGYLLRKEESNGTV